MVICGDQKMSYLHVLNEQLGLSLALSDLKMISQHDDQGKIQAVVGFFNSSQYNIELCVAVLPGQSISRRFIQECAYYAFVTCVAWRITSYVRESNHASIQFHERLGARQEFTTPLKHWFGPEDGLQFVLLHQDCRWLSSPKRKSHAY